MQFSLVKGPGTQKVLVRAKAHKINLFQQRHTQWRTKQIKCQSYDEQQASTDVDDMRKQIESLEKEKKASLDQAVQSVEKGKRLAEAVSRLKQEALLLMQQENVGSARKVLEEAIGHAQSQLLAAMSEMAIDDDSDGSVTEMGSGTSSTIDKQQRTKEQQYFDENWSTMTDYELKRTFLNMERASLEKMLAASDSVYGDKRTTQQQDDKQEKNNEEEQDEPEPPLVRWQEVGRSVLKSGILSRLDTPATPPPPPADALRRIINNKTYGSDLTLQLFTQLLQAQFKHATTEGFVVKSRGSLPPVAWPQSVATHHRQSSFRDVASLILADVQKSYSSWEGVLPPNPPAADVAGIAPALLMSAADCFGLAPEESDAIITQLLADLVRDCVLRGISNIKQSVSGEMGVEEAMGRFVRLMSTVTPRGDSEAFGKVGSRLRSFVSVEERNQMLAVYDKLCDGGVGRAVLVQALGG